MQRTLATIFGFLVLTLGVLGLLVGDRQLFGFINVDLLLDIGRLGLAALLLYAAFGNKSEGLIRTSLMIFAGAYIVLAVGGLVSPTLNGLLPSTLSGFDILFHAGAGLLAMYAAIIEPTTHQAHHA